MPGSLLAATLALASPPSPDATGSVTILCDPARFRMSVRVGPDPAADYPIRRTVSVSALLTVTPNHMGEGQYRAPLTRWEQCGPFAIRLTGSAHNMNVQGRDGAWPPFAQVAIFLDGLLLYPSGAFGGVSLAPCPRDIRACGPGWAVRIDLASDTRGTTVSEHRATIAILDADERIERSIRTVRDPHTVDLWPRDPDRYDTTGRIRPS